MTRIEEFEELRPLLFSIAYRIVGSVSDAEDAVQESWARLVASGASPTSLKAFLSATVTRISIDQLRSAKHRREQYLGPWFPEPLTADPYEDPERAAEIADSMSMAALLLLERLTPTERAVFVLKDVFGFSFAEIAATVGRSETTCRQLAVRARKRVNAERPRFTVDEDAQQKLAVRFFKAFHEGDVASLQAMLASEARMVGDSGGKAPLWGTGVTGARAISRMLVSLKEPFTRVGGSWEQRSLNGQPGAVFFDREGRVLNTWSIDIADGRVQTIRAVMNPDKLDHLGPVGDAGSFLREVIQARKSVGDGNTPAGG